MAKEEANIPLGEDESEVEVTLVEEGNEEQETTVEENKSPEHEAKESPKREASGKDDDDDDELANYSEGVKRRIGKLTYKARENERQKNEALRIAQALKEENDAFRRSLIQRDKHFAQEYENRLKLQEERIKDQLRAAIEAEDSARQAELQSELGKISVEFERVRTAKTNIENAEKQYGVPTKEPSKEQEPVKPRQQPQAPEIKLDPKAEEWASRNEWFGSDPRMTHTAFQIHDSLVAEEGFDPTSDDYYTELDSRMRAAFPHKFKAAKQAPVEKEKPEHRPSQVVAGARPNAPAGKTRSVKLTQSQVAIAKKLGITVEDYARHLQMLNS